MTSSSPPVNLWGHLAAKAARLELAVGAPEPDGVPPREHARRVCLAWPAGALYPPGGPGLSQPGVIPDARGHGLCQPVADRPVHLYAGHRQNGPCGERRHSIRA